MKKTEVKPFAAGKASAVDSDARPDSVPKAQVASLEAQLIGHGLSRHVPAMQGGFDVITNYGSWHVDGELAAQMAEVMRLHLMKQLEMV